MAAAATSSAAFPGQNGRIVFETTFFGHRSQGELASIRPDGTGMKRLTNDHIANEAPAASADGKWIAFNSSSSIWIVRADGTHERQVTHGSKDQSTGPVDLEPAFSPNGKRIVFWRHHNHDNNLWTVRRDGTHEKRLTSGPGGRATPSFSPDGKRIAFYAPIGNPSIQILKLSDGLVTKLGKGFEPDWTPDGGHLVYEKSRPHIDTFQTDIWVMDADGSNQGGVYGNSTFDEESPSASPDGEQVVFDTDSGNTGRSQIWTVSGDSPLQLTNNGADNIDPTWLPG
jgi:TolB protein